MGLTLMAPLVSVLAAKLRVAPPRVQRPLVTGPHRDILSKLHDIMSLNVPKL